MSIPPVPSDPLAALLADAAWLKRLAVGLVGESGAEDLTQEVMVSAMKTPPHGSAAQLRAWAKTVARRLAARRGERGRNRTHAEMRAARPEASDGASEERLHLHRRLTDAILDLEPSHRTVLVLRYLDDLSPNDVAQRLNLAPATARKRISRALAKLREKLDAEFGDRTTWMNAVGPLAFGLGWKDMLPPAVALVPPAAASLPPILALWTMKKLVITSLVLCLAVWVGFETLDGAASGWKGATRDEPHGGLVPMVKPQSESSTTLASAESTPIRGQANPVTSQPEFSPSAQIILVGSDGSPAAGGKGAWLAEDMVVHPLEFDESGHADLPKAALGALCFVRAEGQAISDFPVESVGENITVQLAELSTLSGQLLVDGGPPMESMELECRWYYRPSSSFARILQSRSAPMPQEQAAVLQELGLTSGRSRTRTLPGGQFEFKGVQAGSNGLVSLPSFLRVLPEGRATREAFQN
ncbi:MAG: sigma-70 family RNA polymerase sigma factor, partial [Planctomycetes bacterium]|nr:sigma-70 family RNA polymerase sigma factor [Planctomycetota bacterium]